MLSIIKSMALNGVDGYLINVQVDVSGGLPGWEIVGLPDTAIKESKERIRIAIRNSGIEFPSRKITVNLAPANTKKEGSFLDLPIAIGVLQAIGVLNVDNIDTTVFIGELSLDGVINKVNGILPRCIEAKKLGINRVIVPKENAKEAAIVKDLEVIPVKNLLETVYFLNGAKKINKEVIDIEKMFNQKNNYKYEF